MDPVDSLITFLEDLYNHGEYMLILCPCREIVHHCDYTHCEYCKTSIIPSHTFHCHTQLFNKTYGCESIWNDQFVAECKSNINNNVYNIDICFLKSYQDNKDVYTYNGITLLQLINKVKQYKRYITNQDRLHTILSMVCIDNIKLIEVCLKELCMNGDIPTSSSANVTEYINIVNQL